MTMVSRAPGLGARAPISRKRLSPHGEQGTIGTDEDLGAVGRDDFDARFVGRPLQVESLTELSTHDTLQRQHQPLQFAVQSFERQALLHDGDGYGARHEHCDDNKAVPGGQTKTDRQRHAGSEAKLADREHIQGTLTIAHHVNGICR